jgi:hypothetical protein
MRLILLAIALLLPVSAGAADRGRTVDAPFRFTPPDDRPSGLDAEKARSYREGLRNQLRVEEQRDIGRTATGSQRLEETRRELDRMNRVLQNEPSPPRALPAPAENAPQPAGSSPISGGARHQPTPAEIEERQAEIGRRDKARREAGLGLRPVFDLYGERLQ